MMRSMLKALGINTRATKPETLRSILAGRGVMNWDEIKKSVPTPQEILDDHGVSAVTATAAKEIDVDEIVDAARGDYEAMVEDTIGFDPLVLTPSRYPTDAGLRGDLLKAAVRVVDDIADPSSKNYIELANNGAAIAVHQAVIKRLSLVAGVLANSGKLGLDERPAFMYEHWIDTMRALTAHQIGRGQIPRFQYGSEQPLYLSIDQMIDAMPEGFAQDALFDLRYRVTPPAKAPLTLHAKHSSSASPSTPPRSLPAPKPQSTGQNRKRSSTQ